MYEIKVEGMTCGGCVRAVTQALQTLDPLAQVKVDLSTQKIDIHSKKDQESIKEAIEDAGFSVLSTQKRD